MLFTKGTQSSSYKVNCKNVSSNDLFGLNLILVKNGELSKNVFVMEHNDHFNLTAKSRNHVHFIQNTI